MNCTSGKSFKDAYSNGSYKHTHANDSSMISSFNNQNQHQHLHKPGSTHTQEGTIKRQSIRIIIMFLLTMRFRVKNISQSITIITTVRHFIKISQTKIP